MLNHSYGNELQSGHAARKVPLLQTVGARVPSEHRTVPFPGLFSQCKGLSRPLVKAPLLSSPAPSSVHPHGYIPPKQSSGASASAGQAKGSRQDAVAAGILLGPP